MQIDEIIPEWSKALDILVREGEQKYMEYKFKRGLNAITCEYCCVGEAWGYDAKYMHGECNKCAGFSCRNKYTFTNLITGILKGNIKDWRNTKLIKNFVAHWNEEHLNGK